MKEFLQKLERVGILIQKEVLTLQSRKYLSLSEVGGARRARGEGGCS